jgi:molybdate transport system regulatory protein
MVLPGMQTAHDHSVIASIQAAQLLTDKGRRKMVMSMHVYGGIWMGPDRNPVLNDIRISLLEKIGESGSITHAAKEVGISYKTAWDAIDEIKNLSGDSLVESSAGGKGGGGTRLTDAGIKLVETYRMIQKEHERFLDTVSKGIDDFDNFYKLIRNLSMKTSARNQFFGQVTDIKSGTVNDEIEITLKGNDSIAAVITHESRENLGLEIGSDVWALVKASWVILAPDDDGFRLSARNRLCGVITRVTRGEVNSEVIVTLSGGNTVCAIVTNDSVAEMDLKTGNSVCAVFKASSVILGVAM